ncbi:MAG TPA: response regulator [Thermoanaerobaculia bacterium]|nr:response regulator [Thermoanaerobaculia bacterium]
MSDIAPKAPKSILLIDDDDLIAGSLRQVLQADGCDVDVALDPFAAAAWMRAKSYDVVIVDPYLTGAIHDGAGLLGSIEALQARAFTIVLTAYASPALATAAGSLQSAVMLAKPQSIVSLHELVANRFAQALPSSLPNTFVQRMIE